MAQKELSLQAAQKETDEMLMTISASTAKAERKRGDVREVKNALAEDAAVVTRGKEGAERDVAAAKPALMQAEEALKAITAKDIQNLRALRNPPQLVKIIFDGILILKQQPIGSVEPMDFKGKTVIKDSYPNALLMMSNSTFLSSSLNFERDEVSDETVELVQPYLPLEDWDAEKARAASGNAAGLCTWVRSMCLYHELVKIVAPTIEALRLAEGKLRVTNAKLKEKEDELAVVEGELNEIQRHFPPSLRLPKRKSCRKMLIGLENA